jgi:protein kinase-like protein
MASSDFVRVMTLLAAQSSRLCSSVVVADLGVSVEPEDSLSGSLLPARFEPVRLLGRGGMGAVYLARDRLLCREVAIKILAPELAADAVARERFAREAALAGQLGMHPHVVTAYEAGEWDGRPYLVFEYLPNGSLAERLRERGVPQRSTALRVLAQAAGALDFAHAAKIVHRDVKPSNLLLDAGDNVFVADFGVSRRDGENTITAQGEVLGTVGYLAPEQIAGKGATAASDRYALGVVAYQLLTGALPTGGHAGLGARVDAIFERALADEPERRYPTATAFVDELRAALAGASAPAPTRRQLLPPATTPGARPLAAPHPELARHRQRSRRWRVATGLLAVLLVGAAAAAGGALLERKLNGTAAPQPQAPRVALPTRCTVSPYDNDANLVVSGIGAIRFCRSQAAALSAQGDDWAYRANTQLQAPSHGDPAELTRVCALNRNRLTAIVWDDGSQSIGLDLCYSYAADGWELRSYS